MHRRIKNFYLNGEVSETNLVQTKERLIKSLVEQMRDVGYVPVLDLDPQFTLDYVEDMGKFRFKLTVYGSWVGEKSWDTEGMMNGKRIPRSTARAKSKRS